MKTPSTKILAALILTAALGCNDLAAPETNNPSLESLTDNPTAASVLDATQGMFQTNRDNMNGPAGAVSVMGIIGRESYNLDVADPRWIDQLLGDQLLPGGFGGFLWANPFQDIRLGNLILDALPALPPGQLTEEEQAGIRGFVKTLQAYSFLYIINSRDTNGAPIDVGTPFTEDPAPIESKRAVFDEIVRLLNGAVTDLNAAGGSFAFAFPSGFSGFDTPETFLEFNRALAARVFVYMGGEFDDPSFFNQALTALQASFLDTGADLDLGVFHSFSTQAGDDVNELSQTSEDPNLRAHQTVLTDAEFQADGSLDARVQRKTRPITFRTFGGPTVGSDVGFDIYRTLSDPIPYIRNEELILLRAEANIGLGNLETARQDINLIRQTSGNLEPVDAFADQQEALDRLLFEKRYSLLFEGGHRWIDMRRYGRLDELPLDRPEFVVHERFPFPDGETRPRQ